MNLLQRYDEAVLGMYTSIAKGYQKVFKKEKSDLEGLCYDLATATGVLGIAYGILSGSYRGMAGEFESIPMPIAQGIFPTVEGGEIVAAKLTDLKRNMQLRYVKGYQGKSDPFSIMLSMLIFNEGIITLVASGFCYQMENIAGTPANARFSPLIFRSGIYCLLLGSGFYLQRVDIEPPDGDVVAVKCPALKEVS